MKKELKIIRQSHFNFSLDNFEGPIDLLLHLAKTNELEIADISLNKIIDQYIIYIKEAQQHSIDIASEYLEMAAELIRIKTQSILPSLDSDDELLDELEDLSYDREELIKKLLEYKKYKEVTNDFDDLVEDRLNLFSRTPDKLKEYRKTSYHDSISIDNFINATKRYLNTIEKNKQSTQVLTIKEVTIEENIEILKNIENNFSLLSKVKELDKSNFINLFLALLEALKLQYVSYKEINDDIIICKYKEIINE